jgi:hypothetical protein
VEKGVLMFPQTTEPPDAQASFAAACYVDMAQARISYLSRSLLNSPRSGANSPKKWQLCNG